MCGIAGFAGVSRSAEDAADLLRRMGDAIRHRGPDDDGYHVEPGLGLAMRRLSIIDLTTGHQPMSTPDGRCHIVFNGEIFNYRELRARLEAAGEHFTTTSDTEVLLRLLARHGTAGLASVNGMFAVALWDRREQRLTLIRDRLGVKPLYYSWDGSRFLFASEIKAILASGLVERRLDRQAVWDYLTCRYVPGPRTMWEGVRKLPPGHTLSLTVSASGDAAAEPTVKRYWDIPYQPANDDIPVEQHERRFAELFEDAVALRMLAADVPVGVMLSGGLDSSAVAAVARRCSARLNTFSVGFKGAPEANELAFARTVARHLGTEHHEIEINQADFLSFLPDFVRFTDEPLADLASVPLYYLSRLARGTVKVALSGEGSDEVLAGYDFELRVQDWDAQRLAAGAATGRSRRWPRLPFISRPAPPLPWDQRLAAVPPTMTNYMSSAEKTVLMGGDAFADTLAPLRAAIAGLGEQDPLHQVLYGFCQHWLVEDLLMKADKMSMATSLEIRTPFLDYRLVEWAARSPAALKAGRDGTGRYVSKQVLRRFAAPLLPREIIERPKQGFPVPVYEWLSFQLKDWAHDLLGGPGARLRSLLDAADLDRRVAAGTDPQAGVLDRHRLWNLLILELWVREWLA